MAYVTIQTITGPMRKRATIVGNLAVFIDGGLWTVGHNGTGLAVAKGFPNKEKAMAAANEMDSACDWDGTIKAVEEGRRPNVIGLLREIATDHGADMFHGSSPETRECGLKVRRQYYEKIAHG